MGTVACVFSFLIVFSLSSLLDSHLPPPLLSLSLSDAQLSLSLISSIFLPLASADRHCCRWERGWASTTTATAIAMEDVRSTTRDSCYYPGCRKDANCNCEICLASINATLDLMPISVHKTTLTKLSSSHAQNNDIKCTPISFNALILSTPKSSSRPVLASPVLKSSARSNLMEKMEKSETEWVWKGWFVKLVVGLSLILWWSLVFLVGFVGF